MNDPSANHRGDVPNETVKPIALGALDPAANPPGDPVASGSTLLHALRSVRVTLAVRVGTAEVPLGELADAKLQQVLVLEQPVDEPVDVLLDGEVVARGILVAVDDRFGVRVTEVPGAVELQAVSTGTGERNPG